MRLGYFCLSLEACFLGCRGYFSFGSFFSPKRLCIVSEPVIPPRGTSSGISFSPSAPPFLPEVWDWMRAFALAFLSVSRVPVFFRFLRLFLLRFSSNFPLSIPVLSDPVFLAAEVSGAESSSLAPERVSGVCVHPVSSLFVSPPHSTFRAPQSSWWSLYSVQNRGGPCEQWDSDSIAHSSASGAGDEASVPPFSLAAEALELLH